MFMFLMCVAVVVNSTATMNPVCTPARVFATNHRSYSPSRRPLGNTGLPKTFASSLCLRLLVVLGFSSSCCSARRRIRIETAATRIVVTVTTNQDDGTVTPVLLLVSPLLLVFITTTCEAAVKHAICCNFSRAEGVHF